MFTANDIRTAKLITAVRQERSDFIVEFLFNGQWRTGFDLWFEGLVTEGELRLVVSKYLPD